MKKVKPVKPCQCPQPNPLCFRMGVSGGMVGRRWELCSGKCPPERPCAPEWSENFRRSWDDERRKILPKLSRRIVSFLNAVRLLVLTGISFRLARQRRKICNLCEFRQGDECLKCGCGLRGIRDKTKIRGEKCPIGKWGAA